MTTTIDWNDPSARAALIERVGPAEYERQQQEHWRQTTVATVNGYGIRPTTTRFGRLYVVHGTTRAFQTIEQAKAYAATLPPHVIEVVR